MPFPKPIGTQSSWFAEVLGESIPCIGDYWLDKSTNHYCDQNAYKQFKTKWDRYIEALKQKQKAILTGYIMRDGKPQRSGYVGVYQISNVHMTDKGLEMDVGDRVMRLANARR